ncbi:MAG TPA: hypothetical protein VGO86_19855 [Candidatus Dormibacteraeota bacterium]
MLGDRDWGGDGTVYFGSAFPPGNELSPLPQKHGALANSSEGIVWDEHILLAKALGPPQGAGIGLEVPDAAVAGEPFTIRIAAPALAGITCRYEETGVMPIGSVPLQRADDSLTSTLAIGRPGLYTITARGGGYSAVADDVLIVPPDD